MAELVHVTRWQWADRFQMRSNSEPVIAWLAGRAHVIVVADRRELTDPRNTDREAMDYISPAETRAGVVEYQELRRLTQVPALPFVLIHPASESEQESARLFLEGENAPAALVMVWREQDLIRLWLEARQSTNLLGDEPGTAPDAVALKAAATMVDEEYNGLRSGRGKDTVIHALRALSAEQYPLDPEYWARAIMTAGGSFESARIVARFASEMKAGRYHRVSKERFRPNIVAIWRFMVEEEASATS